MTHLTVKELCERWRIAAGTLQNWRSHGHGPAFLKWGKNILYPMTEIEAWEQKHFRTSTSN